MNIEISPRNVGKKTSARFARASFFQERSRHKYVTTAGGRREKKARVRREDLRGEGTVEVPRALVLNLVESALTSSSRLAHPYASAAFIEATNKRRSGLSRSRSLARSLFLPLFLSLSPSLNVVSIPRYPYTGSGRARLADEMAEVVGD